MTGQPIGQMGKARDASKMPVPWFRATSYNRTLNLDFLESDQAALRPLNAGERRLGRFILPDFQRGAVWSQAQQIRFLESLWSGLPLGNYVVNRCYGHKTDGWLLDGQQRWGAIIAFYEDEFPVFGYRMSELSEPEKREFNFGTVFNEMETAQKSRKACAEIYDRLAYGGTPHAPKP